MHVGNILSLIQIGWSINHDCVFYFFELLLCFIILFFAKKIMKTDNIWLSVGIVDFDCLSRLLNCIIVLLIATLLFLLMLLCLEMMIFPFFFSYFLIRRLIRLMLIGSWSRIPLTKWDLITSAYWISNLWPESTSVLFVVYLSTQMKHYSRNAPIFTANHV